MKQKIDKPDAKPGRLTELFQTICTLDAAVGCLLFIGLPVLIIVAIIMSAWTSHQAVKAVPAEQQQPMIEIPIERTVCVKPAEGYCLEYRTNRIRTP